MLGRVIDNRVYVRFENVETSDFSIYLKRLKKHFPHSRWLINEKVWQLNFQDICELVLLANELFGRQGIVLVYGEHESICIQKGN
jgi:hypothetical protein